MIALVPRSFANGTYFKPFRQWLLNHHGIASIIRFSSRSNLFKGDNVLQENVVIKINAHTPQPKHITMLHCETPDQPLNQRFEVSASLLLKNAAIAMPANDQELLAIKSMARLPLSAEAIGLTVETGRLVECNNRSNLNYENQGAPYVHSKHIINGEKISKKRHAPNTPNALAVNTKTIKWLSPDRNYIVVKRISPNDSSNQRIVGTIYRAGDLTTNAIAFSNGLQILSLSDETLVDIDRVFEYLTSPSIQHFIRAINGTTQLNKSDIQRLRFPKSVLKQTSTERAVA